MLLMAVREEGGWLISNWKLTYRVDWESLLKAPYFSFDYYDDLEVLVDDKSFSFEKKEDILDLEEGGRLTFRGMSKIIKVPLMISFYNQLADVEVSLAMATEEFRTSDYESFNKSLCTYMDSIELAMHR